MEASFTLLKPKRQKLDGGEEMEVSSRSLSNLPDEILRKIISLLDTKEAIRTSILSTRWKYLWTCIPKSLIVLPDVILQKIISRLHTRDAIRTSVLSKRWEYLWTSIPSFNFYNREGAARPLLFNIVERALLLRGPADIKDFSLSFPVQGDGCRVNAWISAAVRRNVQNLYIYLSDLNVKKPFSLPHSLFTAASLTDLELEFTFPFKVPSTVCFSRLRILSLKSVMFSDGSTQKLCSGCPVLEELSLENCSWVDTKYASIYAPKLLKLTIDDRDLELPTGSEGCEVMIFGASLTYFYYRGELQNDYCVYDSTSLGEAAIYVSYNSTKKLGHIAYRWYKLLRGLSDVEDLTLSDCDFFEVVLDNAPELLSQIPLFNELTTLELEGPVDIGSKALMTMLQYCPCLETLASAEGFRLSSGCLEDDGVLKPLPPCFLSHLKRIEADEYSRDGDELRALKILLKNAMALKKMVLRCTFSFEEVLEGKAEVARLLSNRPKGSQSCEIELWFGQAKFSVVA